MDIIHGTMSIRSGKAHIPKILKKEFGEGVEIGYILNSRTVLLCNPNLSPEMLLDSLEALKKHIEARMVKVE